MDPNRRGEKKAPGSQLSRGHKAILLEWRSEQPEGTSRGREWDSQTVVISLMCGVVPNIFLRSS